jgi:hypothetical protein
MVVKAVEIVRKIRDKHYEHTKDLSLEEQIKIIKRKSEELQKGLKRIQGSTADRRT